MTKRMVSFILTLVMVCSLFAGVTMTAWATDETVTFGNLGWANASTHPSYDADNFSLAFAKGQNTQNEPKYYTSDSTMRMYNGNTLTVSASSNITKIVFTSTGGNPGNANSGSLDSLTWTGNTTSVVFTPTGTFKILTITVTTDSSSHTHDYGSWVHNDNTDPSTHTKTCANTDGNCTAVTVTEECNFDEEVTTPPTCSVAGEKTYTCPDCTFSYTESIAIDPNAHTDSDGDGICDDCDLPIPASVTGAIVFGDLGLDNGVQYSDPFESANGTFTVTFGGGGNDGKYYTTGSGIRVYSNGYMTVMALSGTITNITITCDKDGKMVSATTDGGTLSVSETTGTWSGSASSVKFTNTATSGHWRIQSVSVTVVGAVVHNHEYSAWQHDDNSNPSTHTKTCANTDGNCTALTVTEACTFDEAITTPATCSNTGVKTLTCPTCGYNYTEDVAVDPNAHHDGNNDGFCDDCNEEMPSVFVLNTVLHDGDQVVIYSVGGSKVMSTTASGTKLKGVNASIVSNTLTTTDSSTAILTASETEGGWYLLDESGKYLTSSENNNLVFANDAASGSVWTLVVQNDNNGIVTLTSDAEKSLEWYNNFTTYNTGTSEAYQFKLYTDYGVAASYSLTTGAKIGINLYFNNLPTGAKVYDGATEIEPDGGSYTIEVAAQDFENAHTISVKTSDGKVVNIKGEKTKSISAAGYIAAEDTDDATGAGGGTVANVVKAMSNFCKYAKKYFHPDDYTVDSTYPIDGYAVPADSAAVTAPVASASAEEGAAVSFRGASLLLESETTLRFYFNVTNLDETKIGEITVNGSAVDPEKGTSSGTKDGAIYVDVKLAAKDLATGKTVVVTYDGKTATISNYSATRYIQKALDSDLSNNLKNAMKALYVYYQTASAYFVPAA